MKYISTRGNSPAASFSDTLLAGLAPDGGLYLPEKYPQITDTQMESWRNMPYWQLASEIIQLFATDIPKEDIEAMCKKTYTPFVFKYDREITGETGDITPVISLGGSLYLQNLSTGPTLAFKDVALQLVGNLFEYVLKNRDQEMVVMGATTGDTGPAAEHALAGKKGVKVFMMYPNNGGISPFQRAQMTSLMDPNIYNLAVDGTFDEAQDMVKALSEDLDFKKIYNISTVNSINWARIMAQIVYYFYGYFKVAKTNTQKVSFAVPSGNFGNVCAGHIAKQMGLPILNLILSTNENNVLVEFFETGIYRPRNPSETVDTSSPSMDISKASNFERFIFDVVGRNSETVRVLYDQIKTKGFFDLKTTPFWTNVQRFGIVAGESNHAQRLAMIKTVKRNSGLIIDPHTADAFSVGTRLRNKNAPLIVMETAQPMKFDKTIKEALGEIPERHPDFVGLEEKPQNFQIIPVDTEGLKQIIAFHCKKPV
jgi:threonine synthase